MFRARTFVTATVALLFAVAACGEDPLQPDGVDVVEVTAQHRDDVPENYEFTLSEDEIPSGWTTFELDNQSGSTHFGALQKVPEAAFDAAEAEGVDIDDPEEFRDFWVESVADPFQEEWDPFFDEEIGVGEFFDNLVGRLLDTAPWFLDPGAVPSGGPGFTQGMITSETTVFLEPGTYIIECYVLDDDGRFHTATEDARGRGPMVEVLTVTDDPSGAAEPQSTLEVTISTEGIEAEGFEGGVPAGQHTVAVQFADQEVYGHLLGHDVHLIRLEDGTTPDEVNAWMSWLDREGLASTSASPGPTTWVGGVQVIDPTMTLEETGYFRVDLQPGDYALVAEVPDPDGKDMLMEFTVQ